MMRKRKECNDPSDCLYSKKCETLNINYLMRTGNNLINFQHRHNRHAPEDAMKRLESYMKYFIFKYTIINHFSIK